MLPVQTPEITYAGNGSTVTAYPIPFRYDATSWVRAEVIDSAGVVTALTLGSGFTLSGDGALSSGTLRTVVAVVNSSTVRIYRATPKSQETALVYNGVFSSANIERAFDKVTMITQDLGQNATDLSDRAIRVPNGETVNQLPAKADRLDKYMRFNETTGQPEMVTAAEILADSGGAPVGVGIPAGGLEGEILTKASDTSFDVAWSPPAVPPGVYADDLEAFNNGVRVNAIYRQPAGVIKWRQQLDIGKVAFLGDSQTAFGTNNLTSVFSDAYWPWLKVFLDSRLLIQPDATKIPFATGGFKISQMGAHAAAVALTDADFVFIMGGTNDALELGNSAAAVAAMRDIVCAPIIAAGKVPIIVSVLPIPQLATFGPNNNLDWKFSDLIVEQRALMNAMCAEEGIPYYDVNEIIELAPGRADPQYMADDANVHLGYNGCSIIGKTLAARIVEDFFLTAYDPFNPPDLDGIISTNADFSATGTFPTGTHPTGYTFTFNALASIVGSVPTVEGEKVWQLVITPTGAETNGGTIWSPAANTESPAGDDIDSILAIRCLSGRFNVGGLYNRNQTDAYRNNCLGGNNTRKGFIVPEDGEVILQTPIIAAEGGDTRISPWFYGDAVGVTTIQIRRMEVRNYL